MGVVILYYRLRDHCILRGFGGGVRGVTVPYRFMGVLGGSSYPKEQQRRKSGRSLFLMGFWRGMEGSGRVWLGHCTVWDLLDEVWGGHFTPRGQWGGGGLPFPRGSMGAAVAVPCVAAGRRCPQRVSWGFLSPWTCSVPSSDGSSAAPTRSQQRYRPASLRRTARSLQGRCTSVARTPHTHFTLLAHPLHTRFTHLSVPLHTHCTHTHCASIAHALLHTNCTPVAHSFTAH